MRQFLCKRVHVSWCIGWACLGYVIGVGLCALIEWRLLGWIWPFLGLNLIIIACIGRYKWLLLVAFLGALIIGLWRGSGVMVKSFAYQPYYGRNVQLSGTVAQDAAYGIKGDQRLYIKDVHIDGLKLPGEVWVSASKADIKRGDNVTIAGTLNEGFGNLSARMYRAEIVEVVRPSPGDIARRVRDWFGTAVRLAIPEPQVSLGLGYLLGQKTALPPELEDQIRATGLTHVVVASGYNLSILVIFCRRLFTRISKYAATLTSSLLVGSFMMITGFSPSMSRAGLVALLGLLVWYYGRSMHPFVLLSFAASVTVWIQPSYVWGDLGWYLSFLSFIGVIVLAPLVHHYFWGSTDNVPMMRDLLVGTACAQLVTTPIILLSFEQFAVYALLANLLVLPLVPLAMLCTFLAGVFSLIFPSYSSFFGWPAELLLSYSIRVIQYFANLPSALIDVSFNRNLMLLSYIWLCAIIYFLARRTNHNFKGDQYEVV
jgi:competence protein ComEC